MIDAADLAKRLLNREVSPARLRKLQKLIVRAKSNPAEVIAEVERRSTPDVAQQVREALS